MQRSLNNFVVFVLQILFVVYVVLTEVSSLLFYPPSSVLQITVAVSTPVILKDRRIYWDYGYQMNYALPQNPSAFYNVQIWPDQFQRGKERRDLRSEAAKYLQWGNDTQQLGSMHPSDFTAGELYENLEHTLVRYGFNDSCLLRSVCELARHPFADDSKNMLTEILTFVLTPSLHMAFGDKEQMYRTVYEEAERRGFLGEDCSLAYPDCHESFLSAFSKLVT